MTTTTFSNSTTATITLDGDERALWQDETADGRDIADAKRAVRAECEALFARGFTCVEVYAPAEAGGWMVDQYEAE